ncbi:hypothetical protein B0H14DRAFT_3498209 [Mycena olivaceomarginata]|nr:hypothetical protein B0H14DRAFT_3498209 [Mycena olivaceomarginata]
MPGITILPANLATLIVESFLYGLLLLLFISTIYFLATRRTLGGTNQTTKHHFKSVMFLVVSGSDGALHRRDDCESLIFDLFSSSREKHWGFVIYQAFFAFIHLGTNATEDAFYANLAQQPEVLKSVLLFIAVLLGDALVTYRLWIIWGQSRRIIIFPIFALLGVATSAVGVILEITNGNPKCAEQHL